MITRSTKMSVNSRSRSPFLSSPLLGRENSLYGTDEPRGRQKIRESPLPSRRSRSAHSYVKAVSPNYKQEKESTFLLSKGTNDFINKGNLKKKKNSDSSSLVPIKASHDIYADFQPNDIKISPHVMDFLRHNKTFSDLKLKETLQDEIWIQNIKRRRLAELKKEMEKVVCQSYLLDENQYELLCENKKELLSNIETEFQVRGSLYPIPNVGMIPIVFQINPLTNISCVVKSDLENLPVDFIFHWETPKLTSGIPKWQSPTRYMELKYGKQHFEESLQEAFNNWFPPPVTIGINILHSSDIHKVLDVLHGLWEKSVISSACYFILVVPEKKIKSDVEGILKSNPQEGLSNFRVPKSFAVKVIQGNLADQQVDIIVNSADQYLQLKYGNISRSLLKKAGQELQEECKKKYPNGINFPEYAVTHGHNLPCKYVIHGALPKNNNEHMVIKEFVDKCLEFMAHHRFASIAFPALGTGILKYTVSQVVQQMNEAFIDFEMNYPETSIQEIKIVLYSNDKELDLFYKMDNSRNGLSKTGMPLEPSKSNLLQSINWIQFVNYSCIKENLPLAIGALEEQLKQHNLSSVKIPLEDFEDVFFFKDLHSVIPNIVQQLNNKKEKFYHLHLSAETKDKLNRLILEVKKNICQEQLNTIQPVSCIILEHCLLKARQLYPQVKFIVTNNSQNVIIESLDWNVSQKAKYFLEVWLGIKSPLSVPKDRFEQINSLTPINGPVSVTSPAVTMATQSKFSRNYQDAPQPMSTASSTQESAKNQVFTQNNQDICYFQTENGLLVKVYCGDILNLEVEGIVNAANRWLKHSGGVARAIINAAGDDVNREGQFKLGGKTLDDGEVLSTSAGNLKQYKNIIHAVGPIYALAKNDEYCYEKIAMAVSNSFEEAMNLNLQSLALPALSSAIFGVPLNICVNGYYAGILIFCKKYPNSCLKEIHFVDMNDVSIKEIKHFFKSHLIFINEESNSSSNSQSLKDLHKPLSASKTKSSSSSSSSSTQKCSICLENLKNPIILKKCKHKFCKDCIRLAFKSNPKCPHCKMSYGIEIGNQPPGTMTVFILKFSLDGYEKTETYKITYKMEDPFTKVANYQNAYLPVNKEGNIVLKMLQLAFERRLIFTVGESATTGAQNVITWNDIHHKTSLSGGQSEFGYPDPTYLKRVAEELASHGITPNDVVNRKTVELVQTS